MAAERTVPDDRELLALLNRAFDGWGSERYFEWKYDAFPGYDPERDNFVATNDDGEVVAARRVFERPLQTPDGRATVHVHGGTVVDPDYQGRGHYSRLLEESMVYSREHADHVVTFNRAGKITTDHHLENGWRHLTLPVRTRVLSPSRVLAHYVVDHDAARTVAGRVAAIDRRLTRSDAVSRLLATAAGAIYGGGDGGANGGEGAPGDRNGRTDGDATPPATPDGTCTVEILDGRDLEGDGLQELADHLEAELDAPYHFERSAETLRHAARYPGASVYVARDGDGDLRDFLVAGTLQKEGFAECRVVEQTWADPAATRRLFERVEADARREGADVIVTCSAHSPGPNWIEMGTEYMMWPPDVGEGSLPASPAEWRLTAYDVL
jgi:GNAT superfamily N-acetyltransferase